MKSYHLPLPVNLRLMHNISTTSDFEGDGDYFQTTIEAGECVAIMAVLTEGITEELDSVVREICDFSWNSGRFSEDSDEPCDIADVWLKVTDRTGEIFEVDLEEFIDPHQIAILDALKESLKAQQGA